MYNYYYTQNNAWHSDLACERHRINVNTDGIIFEKTHCPIGFWEKIKITSECGAKALERPCGIYDTLHTKQMDMLEEDEIYDAAEEISKKLCEIFDDISVIPARILVVGMGNPSLTVDSVGTKSATRVKPTMHIREYDEDLFDKLECSEIAVYKPGVCAQTGIDTYESVKAICNHIAPDAIIAIDSIMTSSKARLGSTIQISDTGVFPGGIGNLKKPITRSTLGIPVIGIGIPTVIDSRCLATEKEQIKNSDALYVSPREIDEITDSASKIISKAINQAFGFCY